MTAPPPPNPQMITLARLSRGLTQVQLAARTGIAQGTLSKMEGGSFISETDVASFANALAYPKSFFYRRDSFEGPGIVELFHARKRKLVKATLLNQAYAGASIRRMHVETMARSYEISDDIEIPLLPTDELSDAAKVARTVRAQLSIPPGPVYNMSDVVESAGGIIVNCDFESQHIDGFTRLRRPGMPPMFFMNRELAPDRWRWTLAHELGHAVMHSGMYPSETAEEEADAFAEELLLPRQIVRSQLVSPTIEKLSRLKLYWKVSVQALIQRAYHLDIITARQRSFLFMQWSRAGNRMHEPEELSPPAEPPRTITKMVTYHLNQLRYSVVDLADAIGLLESEFRKFYLPGAATLRVVQ